MPYKYIPYESVWQYAKESYTFICNFSRKAVRKRRRVFNSRLADAVDIHSEDQLGYPVGMSAIHLRTVNLGNGRYFEPCKEVVITPEIVRFSDKCAFDRDGRRYLKSCIVAYTDMLDAEVVPYEHAQR